MNSLDKVLKIIEPNSLLAWASLVTLGGLFFTIHDGWGGMLLHVLVYTLIIVLFLLYLNEKRKAMRLYEETLKRAEKGIALVEMAAGIAHEIRNPLTSLRGFVQLMSQNPVHEKDPYLPIMISEIDRIALIVEEMLLLSKPQQWPFEKRGLAEIVESVTTLVRTQAIMHNVNIHLDVGVKRPLQLWCRENKLKQVFLNVLKNAIEASQSESHVRVSIEQDFKFVSVVIRDEGCGIPQEMMSSIGKPFFTTKSKGNGLGLATCIEIMKEHHGRLDIQSRLGRGTVVALRFPRDFFGDEQPKEVLEERKS